MNFRSFEDMVKAVRRGMHKVPTDIDAVAFIPRSGIFPASMIALYRNVPLTDVDSLAKGSFLDTGTTRKVRKPAPGKRPKYLIVDDSVLGGRAMDKARSILAPLNETCTLVYCAIFGASGWEGKADFIFEEVESPRIFEWNFLRHSRLGEACLDIDGVICADPLKEQNDDGEKYRKFIDEAAPFMLPMEPVGFVVSSRLEKYRAQTEKYLDRHGVKYGELVLLDGVTAEERRKGGMHAKFKASVYKRHKDMQLFIESDPGQAREINRLTGKPVICTETMQFYGESFTRRLRLQCSKAMQSLKRRIRRLAPGR
jgi:uncharacterized HAD superfamily protein/adenine/guanine phosphoribosyltransferase-like PRPP-binding protein